MGPSVNLSPPCSLPSTMKVPGVWVEQVSTKVSPHTSRLDRRCQGVRNLIRIEGGRFSWTIQAGRKEGRPIDNVLVDMALRRYPSDEP